MVKNLKIHNIKDKKYHLKKVIQKGTIILTSTIIATLFVNQYSPQPLKKPLNSELTTSDLEQNQEILNNLNNLKKLDPASPFVFSNNQIKTIVYQKLKKDSHERITLKELQNIKELNIELTTNEFIDLTDLKYMSNLQTLTINKASFDANDLSNNIKLRQLDLKKCHFYNSQDLPNSIYSLHLYGSKCHDEVFKVPYYTGSLFIDNSNINNLSFKTPSNIAELIFNSTSTFDFKCLEGINQTFYLSLTYAPNVINTSSIKKLNSNILIYTNDYGAIWLTQDIVDYLDKRLLLYDIDKNELKEEITYLDNLTKKIITPNLTAEEKINLITQEVINQIEYDPKVINDDEEADKLSENYNRYPLKSIILNKEKAGVCINYACLFTALANRANISTYVICSTNHAWNYAQFTDDYYCIDPTSLDTDQPIFYDSENTTFYEVNNDYKNTIDYLQSEEKNQLAYYQFPKERMTSLTYFGKNYPVINPPVNQNIGYIPAHVSKSLDAQITDRIIIFIQVGFLITDIYVTSALTKINKNISALTKEKGPKLSKKKPN